MSKPILVLDFDGVIHSYTSPWIHAAIISDPPVIGAFEFIEKALEHFEVHIFSSRSRSPEGIQAMKEWMWKHEVKHSYTEPSIVYRVEWPTVKPAAFLSIDDRAMLFTGEWPEPADLLFFKPWNKQ